MNTDQRSKIIEDISILIEKLREEIQLSVYSDFTKKYKDIPIVRVPSDSRVIISSQNLNDQQLYELYKNLVIHDA